MIPWRFFDFARENGENPFETWHERQDLTVRGAFYWTLWRRQVMADWRNPAQKSAKKQFKVFSDKQLGLAELRFWPETDGRKFRAVGLFRPDQRDFILFAGCQEFFGGAYYRPSDVMKVAMMDKRAFDERRGSLIERAL